MQNAMVRVMSLGVEKASSKLHLKLIVSSGFKVSRELRLMFFQGKRRQKKYYSGFRGYALYKQGMADVFGG